MEILLLILVYVQEAFGEGHVTFNCSENVKRLPNTCNVSLSGEGLVGHVVLSKCSCIMASTGAACHGQNKPSGSMITFLNLCILHPVQCYGLTFSGITLQNKTFLSFFNTLDCNIFFCEMLVNFIHIWSIYLDNICNFLKAKRAFFI